MRNGYCPSCSQQDRCPHVRAKRRFTQHVAGRGVQPDGYAFQHIDPPCVERHACIIRSGWGRRPFPLAHNHAMYILDLCKTMITGFAEGQLPPPEQVARVVTDPIGRREVLAHPAFAIALMEEAQRISGLDCEEVGDQLALAFPSAAVATSSVLSIDHFTLHLQLCPFCAEEYGLARDIEAAQDAGILPPWPRPAPPGASTPPSVRWLPPLDLVVPNMPLKVPTSQVSRAWRGEHVAGQIVYADAVPGSELLLRATLTQLAAATPDSWELEVEIMPPPQTSYRLRLQHGTATVETDADSSGIARFSGIPDAWITAEPPLSLSVGMP